ncbi:MAG: flagellar filament capping protein FliD [Hungatella sp.]|nr:flagellar filament capping protein FliD [Hungatella sp.]
MASISSTNSASSLGNTSLRGFGGMVSGIDRDSIVEQMTLGTTTKINNQKKKLTQLQWKMEAYRGVSDKIIDLTDKFASYSSGSNLKDASVFAKNKITVHGRDEVSRFVTATGSSALSENVSIKGVQQLATSTVLQSGKHVTDGLQTALSDLEKKVYSSNLEGAKITFGGGWNDQDKKYTDIKTFTFASSYETVEGDPSTKKTIDYTLTNGTIDDLAKDLNVLLERSEIKFGETDIKDALEFKVEGDKIVLKEKSTGSANGYAITSSADSNVLKALGYEKRDGDVDSDKKSISFENFAASVTASSKTFQETAINSPTTLQYMTGKKVTFNFNGSKKEIELITQEEKNALQEKINKFKEENKANGLPEELTQDQQKALLEDVKNNLQGRLDRAFGEDSVVVSVEAEGLNFKTSDETSTVSIVSSDSELLKNMGIDYGASSKVNLSGKLSQFDWAETADIADADGNLKLTINGVEIKGLTTNSSISDILSKINSTKEAGVKATYVDATGQFMLVSSETGAGRKIELEGDLANKLFGFETGADGKPTGTDGGKIEEGKDAIIYVSYGNGIDVKLNRSSNTFNLEGLNVTVSGTFGVKTNADGKPVDKNGNEIPDGSSDIPAFDTADAITFTAKADVDGVTEKVKSFFEDFNALVTEINKQVTSRPDSSYGPLTDEQKEEMDETSIENWEKKAKQGLLYGDSAMQDLNMDVQAIFTKLMQNGASYDDLKEMGITYSEDYLDGGTLVFDESKFRQAMESDPDKVAEIFTGGGDMKKGLINVVEDTFTPYATRYASKNAVNGSSGSYGRLIDIAGSEKKPTTLMKNQIYNQMKDMEETIAKLQDQLRVEQDRYISQFTTMETLINKMNTQSSYLSQITG